MNEPLKYCHSKKLSQMTIITWFYLHEMFKMGKSIEIENKDHLAPSR